MVEVLLNNIHVQFPVLHTGHRSLKKAIIATATGGVILHEARRAPLVNALAGISAHLVNGDRIGLIGPNGAGKSTLLRVIAGIYEPNEGRVDVTGRVMPLLDLGLGFDGDLTGRENIRLRGLYLGIKPSRLSTLAPEITAFTELGEYINMPVRTYSSGMQMRLALGIATAIDPEILLMDEWMMAGDAHFMDKARKRMTNFVEKARILVLASHSDAIIREWCNKAIFLRAGRIEAFGSADDVLRDYEGSHS